MVVCKFFQQGNCRYGQSCRFQHIYGSKYSYQAPVVQATQSAITDEQLVNQVQTDVQAALNGGQWILTSYSPFKEKPNLPGLSDLSMEEARLFIYEAKANNNLEQAVYYIHNLIQETRSKYEQLLNPNATIMKVLRSLYKGEIVQSPFLSNVPINNAPSSASLFRDAVQNTSVFGQNNVGSSSIFGGPPAFGQNSMFGQNSNATEPMNQESIFGADTAAKSIFAQATQSIFGQSQPINIFGSNQPTQANSAQSIFAQANQNAFNTNQPQSDSSNIFRTASKCVFASSPFSQPQENTNVFTSTPFSAPSTSIFDKQNPQDKNIYSDPEEVSSRDMECFKADGFQLGFIPEIAPPYSVCF
ncbi:hypothetical protein ACJJTC_009732 [Scirpophaga incertulas]